MQVSSYRKLAWRYRFNDEVEVDTQNQKTTFNGELIDIENPEMIAQELSKTVMCKSCIIHKIDKGNGSFRYVYDANSLYKEHLRSFLPELEARLTVQDTRHMFHAFRSKYNAVSNARAHVGYNYSATFDLKSFFDTVHSSHLQDLPTEILNSCLIEDTTKQGLSTSPMLASLALLPYAYKLEDTLKDVINGRFVMTIYADDITVSFNNRMSYEKIKQEVYKAIKWAGFKVNYKKTKLKFGHKNGMRRIICGVAVGQKDVTRTRYIKRKIRSAVHKKETFRANGLFEWAKCKMPNRSSYGDFV